MSKKRKIVIAVGIIVICLLVETIFFLMTAKPRKLHALTGTAIPVLSNKHVPDNTKITYNSNPPTSGMHYARPQDAGIYPMPPADGHLVHSMEHGAIILWYNPQKLSSQQISDLKDIFTNMALTEQKIIMTPRTSMDVPIAITSWGRMLRLTNIDEKMIKHFFTTNYDQGPEEAEI